MGVFNHFRKFWLAYLLLTIAQSIHGYDIDPTLKFSEMVDRIPLARHFENLTISHPFYDGIARETLPLEHFMAMTQQDHLYVDNLFRFFRLLAERETDPERKAYLQSIGDENWDDYWQVYYDKFNFSKPQHMVPPVLEYAVSQLSAAKHDNIPIALATAYPCYTVWAKMGSHIEPIADIINNPDHLYKEFIEANSGGMDSPVTQEFIAFVDGYYSRLGNDTKTKQAMLHAYTRSVQYEFSFAETNYHLQRESQPPPNFTDLVESYIATEFQADVIYHKLYEDIGNATLPMDIYAVLMQQDHLYMHGFYTAFLYMKNKETDPDLKLLLTKDPTGTYAFFQDQYDKYNFEPAFFTDVYTKAYSDHIMNIAQHESVAEGLSGIYPCYVLWSKMGEYIASIANLAENPDHPYKDFVQFNDPEGSTSLARMQSLINGYFLRLEDDLETKLEMFKVVEQSTLYEVMFANGVYKMGRIQEWKSLGEKM